MKFTALAIVAVTLAAATDKACPARTKEYNAKFLA